MAAPYLALVISGQLQTQHVQAADNNHKFAMKGAGALSCQIYVTERQKKSDVYYMIGGWIEGYISAYNRFTPSIYDITSFESLELLLAVIDSHCQSHATDPLHGVLSGVLTKLRPDAIQLGSEKIEISEGERRTRLYRETLRRVQTELTQLGLYKGQVDGRFTDETRSALIAFQSDIGHESTGFPDQTTLWRLLRK